MPEVSNVTWMFIFFALAFALVLAAAWPHNDEGDRQQYDDHGNPIFDFDREA